MIERNAEYDAKMGLRTSIKEKRRHLPQDYCRESDRQIRERVESLAAYQKAARIFCYVSTEEEVDTRTFLEDALKDGKRVAVPKCRKVSQGGTKGIMDAVEIRSLDDLQPGAYGILEPKDGCWVVPSDQLQLCIVPCLAASKNGGRLGYGGGYYDRYLPLTGGIKVVLCREELVLEDVPLESHDCRMDMLVTEKQIYCSGSERGIF